MSSPAQSNVSSSPVTPRDRVWSGVVNEVETEFTVADIKSRLRRDGYEGEPSEETIKRVLRSMDELNVIQHKDGSPYYNKQTDFENL
ncbi:hypothetical protein [Haloquadratum walsbyi]|jgi:hypothetical protein|uniref:Uncharacterized protein n=1 Tax=Haloquadratum walsbyi J07HQW2 TaxID=1238425 RepID=U1PJV6_9EURY|nr:hypothetical protein [Haloquadratum walsbyi]ERG93942.1 MAG: hypothetical protein J07HQW2_00376 [Haloquadratum walsbyi J07HQW2]